MGASDFTILSKVQDIEVKFDELKGNFDGVRSFLNVFIAFTYRRPHQNMSFDVLTITGKLRLGHSGKLLSETIVTPGVNIRMEEFSTGEWFNFVLDDASIHAIETHRVDDLTLCIDLSIVVLNKSAFQSSQNSQLFYSVEGTIRDNAKITFTIPQSVWVKKIHPALGINSFKLIEIPLYHKKLKEAYKDIVDEFNKAEEYFNKGDYNKTVAH